MFDAKIRVAARRDFPTNRAEVAIMAEGPDALSIGRLTFYKTEPGARVDPTLIGADGVEFLQAALDCAWEFGLRPTGVGHSLEQPAISRHLEDMRALAFFHSGAEKPDV